jgi:hypothetical protein
VTYTITVPDVPPSLNKVLRMHWAVKRRLKMNWGNHFYGLPPSAFKFLAAKAYCRSKMRMVVTIYNSRQYDRDNAFGACKIIADAAREAGMIYDDRPEFFELNVEQVKSTRKDKRTVIEIGPAEAA